MYVLGDPVNASDRTGTHLDCDDDSCDESDCSGDAISCLMAGGGSSGGGGGGACDSVIATGSGCDTVIATANACATPNTVWNGSYCDVPIYQSPLITDMFNQIGSNLQGANTLLGAAAAPYLVAAAGTVAITNLPGFAAAGIAAGATPQGQEAASSAANAAVDVGSTVYRVWGGDSLPFWSVLDHREPNHRSELSQCAGLPPGNTAEFLTTGVMNNMTGVTTGSAVGIGSNLGGIFEVNIPNAICQVSVVCVQPFVPHP